MNFKTINVLKFPAREKRGRQCCIICLILQMMLTNWIAIRNGKNIPSPDGTVKVVSVWKAETEKCLLWLLKYIKPAMLQWDDIGSVEGEEEKLLVGKFIRIIITMNCNAAAPGCI